MQVWVAASGWLVLVVLLAAILAVKGCSQAPPKIETPELQYNIEPETWRAIDRQILAASVHARHESDAYIRIAMDEWLWRVRQNIEDDFIPWYSDYMTQKWITTKIAWYKLWYTEGEATPEERLVDYLQEQFYKRVLEPVSSYVDPYVVMVDTSSIYLREFKCLLDELPREYHIPEPAFGKHLESIPAIVVQEESIPDVSLYDALQTGDITGFPAFKALLSHVPAKGSVDKHAPLTDRLHIIARRAVTELADSLALRGGTTAASTMIGGIWGVVISAGATIWDVNKHDHNKLELEAQLYDNLDAALDLMWQGLVEDKESGVMALVHHISTQVEYAVFHLPKEQSVPARNSIDPVELF